jgi:hypothetical protein
VLAVDLDEDEEAYVVRGSDIPEVAVASLESDEPLTRAPLEGEHHGLSALRSDGR